ncbi:ABC transporter permease [Rhodoflexus caldus]|uniref:ABC transporter permease n=1 Tax=Rhodoflexus caldus TaxID=2891236 RepID=UPI00202A24CA|nr:ABC transporter permease [Rhodoflexus caldus]
MIIWLMAWRNIWRNKMRSLVIMFSIALGLFAGIAVLALYKGMMKSRIRTVIDEEIGHLQIHQPQFKDDYEPVFLIPDAEKIVRQLQALPQVKQVALRSLAQGMLSTPTGSTGVQINGIVPEEEYDFSSLRQKIAEGEGFNPEKRNQVLIGRKLADKMKLKTGSKLVLTFTDTANNIVAGAFRVAAVFQSTNTALDERNVYVRQSELNALLGIGEGVHEIAVLLHRDEDVAPVLTQIRQQTAPLRCESWQEISPETNLMVKTVDDYSYIIMIIIMVALAFGIVNTMLMAIMERTREIGMMAALGTGRLRIFLLVLTETVLLTLAGAPVGIAIGWAVSTYYSYKGLNLAGMGEDMMGSFGFRTMVYPEFPGERIVSVLIIVVATALIASILPAVKALRMKPIDALRN